MRSLAPSWLSIVACLALLWGGCSKKEEVKVAPKPKQAALPKPATGGVAAGSAELARAVQAVVDRCEVTEHGYASNCKDEAYKALIKQEGVVGVKEALRTYCYALSDKNHLIRALAATQINRFGFSKRMKQSADEKVLACLMGVVGSTKQEHVARPVVRAAAYMATALKQEAQLIAFLAKTDDKPLRASGYGALWANGRLRVFDTLARVIKDDKQHPDVRINVINGFALGGLLEPEEQAKICQLVSPLMTGDDLRVAAAAANRVANSCPQLKDKVLDAAEAMLKQGRFDPLYTSAVRNIDGVFKSGASAAQKRRAAGLLKRALEDDKLSDVTRGSALRKLGWLDQPAGAKLAKKYLKSDSEQLRKAADFVLKKK